MRITRVLEKPTLFAIYNYKTLTLEPEYPINVSSHLVKHSSYSSIKAHTYIREEYFSIEMTIAQGFIKPSLTLCIAVH